MSEISNGSENFSTNESVRAWQDSYPEISGDPKRDAQTLTGFCKAGESILTSLPQKPDRTSIEQGIVNHIFSCCRALRKSFVAEHAYWIYKNIAKDKHEALSDFVFRAAELVPELVPSRSQLENENAKEQKYKEGRELDQGIFFWGLLRNKKAGRLLINDRLKPCSQAISLLSEFQRKKKIQFEKIHIELENSAALITFHNEDCLNAEDNTLIREFEIAVDLVLLSDNVNVGILRGGVVSHRKYEGKRIFSAGVNLKHLSAGKISFTDFMLARELGYINKMFRGISVNSPPLCPSTSDKPWIAAVDTFAIGGGMQLLLACDIVIADSESYLALPAANEGIIPGVSNLRLQQFADAKLAHRLIVQGRKINANDDDAKRLIDYVVTPDEMDSTIQQAVKMLRTPAALVNRRMIFKFQEPLDIFREYMAEFSLCQSERLYGSDVLNKSQRFNT